MSTHLLFGKPETAARVTGGQRTGRTFRHRHRPAPSDATWAHQMARWQVRASARPTPEYRDVPGGPARARSRASAHDQINQRVFDPPNALCFFLLTTSAWARRGWLWTPSPRAHRQSPSARSAGSRRAGSRGRGGARTCRLTAVPSAYFTPIQPGFVGWSICAAVFFFLNVEQRPPPVSLLRVW